MVERVEYDGARLDRLASAVVLQTVKRGGADPAFVAMVVLRTVVVVVVVGLTVRGYTRRLRERGHLCSESRRWPRGKGTEPEASEGGCDPPNTSATPIPDGVPTRDDDCEHF